MTSVTQRAVCEHSLIITQNMPYGLFSIQHRSFAWGVFRKRFEIRRKNKSDFFDHRTTLNYLILF